MNLHNKYNNKHISKIKNNSNLLFCKWHVRFVPINICFVKPIIGEFHATINLMNKLTHKNKLISKLQHPLVQRLQTIYSFYRSTKTWGYFSYFILFLDIYRRKIVPSGLYWKFVMMLWPSSSKFKLSLKSDI